MFYLFLKHQIMLHFNACVWVRVYACQRLQLLNSRTVVQASSVPYDFM